LAARSVELIIRTRSAGARPRRRTPRYACDTESKAKMPNCGWWLIGAPPRRGAGIRATCRRCSTGRPRCRCRGLQSSRLHFAQDVEGLPLAQPRRSRIRDFEVTDLPRGRTPGGSSDGASRARTGDLLGAITTKRGICRRVRLVQAISAQLGSLKSAQFGGTAGSTDRSVGTPS